MNMPICNTFTNGRLDVTVAILCFLVTKETTPEQFDQRIAKIPNFQFDQGMRHDYTPFAYAAHMGNIRLMCHIFYKAGVLGPSLLKIGNEFGFTPLHAAATCQDEDKGLLAAKTLINWGTKVNIGTSWTPNEKTLPIGFSPLWLAATSNKVALAKLLIENGALVDPQPIDEKGNSIAKPKYTPLGQKIIDQIMEDRKTLRFFIMTMQKIKTPKELIGEIHKQWETL